MFWWILYCFVGVSNAQRACPKGRTRTGCPPKSKRDMNGCCSISAATKKKTTTKKTTTKKKRKKKKIQEPKKESGCIYSSSKKRKASSDTKYTSGHAYASTKDGRKILQELERMRQQEKEPIERMEWAQRQSRNKSFDIEIRKERVLFLLHIYTTLSDLLPTPSQVKQKCPKMTNRSQIDDKNLRVIKSLKKDEILGDVLINISNYAPMKKCMANLEQKSRKCGYVLAQEALKKYIKTIKGMALPEKHQRKKCRKKAKMRIFDNKGGSQQKFWLMLYEDYCSKTK